MSDFEVILSTCKRTLNPPKPSKKEQTMILLEIAFWLISQTKRKPLVSSKIPEAIGVIKWFEIPNRRQKGVKIV